MKVTNPDALKSDCMRCARRRGDQCVLSKRSKTPIAAASVLHTRCMYWDEVVECRK